METTPFPRTDGLRTDGREKSAGSARYTTDYYPSDCLRAKIFRSTKPHARIRVQDLAKAKRVPGIRAVVTGRDYPQSRWGTFLLDQPVFAVDKVRHAGEPVAGVAGGTEDAVEEAVRLIEIEYEELPFVLDPIRAMDPDAPLIHENLQGYERDKSAVFPVPGTNICNHFKLRRGDIGRGFRESDLIVEDTFLAPMVQHCPLEPHACVCLADPRGKITLWTSTQGPYLARNQVARAFGLPPETVRVLAPYCGGGFGGKISACAEVLCAALALKAPGRPVRLAFDREEEFTSTFVRQEFIAEYKTGVLRDGTLRARQVKLIWNTGAFGDYEVSVSRTGGYNSAGPYNIPAVHIDSYCVYTNGPKAGAFRGFGVPEACFGYEQQLDKIAKALDLDPLEIRRKNLLREGDRNATGQTLVGVGLEECLRKVSEALGPFPAKSDGGSGSKRRGLGIACMLKSTVSRIRAEAEIRITDEGAVLLKTSAIEHGQGAHTVLRQIAGACLGQDPQTIHVAEVDTDSSPYTWSTSASKTTFFDGNAVKQAAEALKRKILQKASDLLEIDPNDLYLKDGTVSVRGNPGLKLSIRALRSRPEAPDEEPLAGEGRFIVEDATPLDPETGQGKRPAAFFMFAAQGAEVEVDLETGVVNVVRLVAAHDVGHALHRKGCEGQIEGALVQGLGTALFEALRCENGVVINGTFNDYKIPTSLDMPALTPLIVEAPIPDGPWGAKGVGEPGLVPTAAAIGNAIYAAIGRQIKELPFTPDKLYASLRR